MSAEVKVPPGSCPDDKHEKIGVVPWMHPTANIWMRGVPPRTEEEHAWCLNCGALWTESIWGGWAWRHPRAHGEHPNSIIAIMRRVQEEKKAAAKEKATKGEGEVH